MVSLPSPSVPGFASYAFTSAAPAEPASRTMRLIVASNRAESGKIDIFDIAGVRTFGEQAHKRKIHWRYRGDFVVHFVAYVEFHILDKVGDMAVGTIPTQIAAWNGATFGLISCLRERSVSIYATVFV